MSTTKEAIISIARDAVRDAVGGADPHPWQVEATAHILAMMSPKVPDSDPGIVMMVQATGGGKSAVRDAIGLVAGGVILTIVPLLSLGADQTAKLQAKRVRNGLPINVFHIDEYQGSKSNGDLLTYLHSLPKDRSETVYLFSSPQKLATNKEWKHAVKSLIKKGVLSCLVLDEAHLFATFGTTFRKEIVALRPFSFDLLRCSALDNSLTKVPILCLTASGDEPIVDSLQLLTGIAFNFAKNILWPTDPAQVSRRSNLFMEVIYQEHPMRPIKTVLRRILVPGNKKKTIVYTNSLSKSNRLLTQIQEVIDAEELSGDMVLVNGDLFREQKFHNIQTFCGEDLHDSVDGTIMHFHPRVLLATAGATNAGIDDKDVHIVIRDGFPPSMRDLAQETGRVGRRPDAMPSTDRVLYLLSFISFKSLLY